MKLLDEVDNEAELPEEDDAVLAERRARNAAKMRALLRAQGVPLRRNVDSDC